MSVWVHCIGGVLYDEHGVQKQALPGDWIQIGKHQARQLLLQGTVEIPAPHRRADVQDLDKCGVVVRADEMPDVKVFGALRHVLGEPSLPYDYTVLWTPSLAITQQGFEVGLLRLNSAELGAEDSWEALATLVGLSVLAKDVGTTEEQEKTKEAVGDLRLPVYDTRLLWIRKTSATENLIEKWVAELAEGADEQHAFLRALYSSRVMMCTLPPGWQNRQVQWYP